MATRTPFLKLVLPLNSEYNNTWDQPVNSNFVVIDNWSMEINDELVAARGSADTLGEFLAVGHNSDGSLLPTEEVIKARQSFMYGDNDGTYDFDLTKRFFNSDKEIFDAREAAASLRDSLAYTRPSYVVSGSKDANGYPTWMGYTGTQVNVDGSVTPIMLLIDGHVCRIRTNKQLTISGSSGLRHIYAQFSASGQIVIDGDASTPPPATSSGSTSSDSNKVTLFGDATVNFTTSDVKVGDLLRILGTGTNAGYYRIKEIAPSGNVNQIKIWGYFPGGAVTALNYLIYDPLAVTLGADTSITPAEGKLYIGEADWDGSSVTEVRARHFKDFFVSEWRAVDVSSSPTFEEIFNHRLGSAALEITIQASSASDESAPVEELSVANLSSTLALNFTNTLGINPGTFDPGIWTPGGTQPPSYNPLPSYDLPSLTGNITSSLSGSVFMNHSVAVKYTKNQIFIKNVKDGLFYKDYSGADCQTGFIRVIVRKRA